MKFIIKKVIIIVDTEKANDKILVFDADEIPPEGFIFTELNIVIRAKLESEEE